MNQQTKALNQLCMKNGFLNATNKTAAHLIANSRTFVMGSLASLNQGEVSHIQTIARMYYDQNEPTPESDLIFLRHTRFYGG